MFENNEYNFEENEYTSVSSYCNQEPEIITAESDVFEEAPKKEEPKKDNFKKVIAASMVICILLSACFGAAGAYVVNKLMNKEEEIVIEENKKEENYEITVSEDSMNTIQIAKAASPSVVEISTESIVTSIFMQQYVTAGAGSGVILTEDGYIVTNYHVIEDVNKITVKTNDGQSYQAYLVGSDESNDLAVIKITAENLKAAELSSSDSVVVGQKVVAIGNPLGSLGGTVTEGIVSALDREINISGQPMNLLQTSAAINPGNSGGGLFDENAKLIGIVNAKSYGSEIEGLGFAIPIDTVKEVTSRIMENGAGNSSSDAPTGVKLGITVIEINDRQTASMYRVDRMGVYIVNVELNSNAYNAGLQAGDCIIAIGEDEITDSDDISACLKKYSPGETITITYARNGREAVVQTFLGAN